MWNETKKRLDIGSSKLSHFSQNNKINKSETNSNNNNKRNLYGFICWSNDSNEFNLSYAPVADFGIENQEIDYLLIENCSFCDPIYADIDTLNNINDIKNSIVFIERGKCIFPNKAERVQKVGALAAIIINNDIINKDSSFIMGVDKKNENKVNIPTVMVSYQTGKKIKENKPNKISLYITSNERKGEILKNKSLQINTFHTTLPNLSIDLSSYPLHRACYEGKLDQVKELIQNNKNDSINSFDHWYMTPLHYCVLSNHIMILEYLVLHINKDLINKQDIMGHTPLHYACFYGYNKIIQLLVSLQDIDLSIKNIGERTCLHLACLNGNAESTELIITSNAQMDSINQNYTFYGINEIDLNGSTPFHLASKEGNEECCLYLLAANAQSHIKDKNNKSSLEYIIDKINQYNNNNNNKLALSMDVNKDENCNKENKKYYLYSVLEKIILANDIDKITKDTNHKVPFEYIQYDNIRKDIMLLYLKSICDKQTNKISILQEKQYNIEKELIQNNHINKSLLNFQYEMEKELQKIHSQYNKQTIQYQNVQKKLNILLTILQNNNQIGEREIVKGVNNVNKMMDNVNIENIVPLNDDNEDKIDYQELAVEAALARDIGKKLVRNKSYNESINYFKKSIQLYPLPGVQKLLERAIILKKKKDEIIKNQENMKNKINIIDQYKISSRKHQLPIEVNEVIEAEIMKLKQLSIDTEEYDLLIKWINWLISLPWESNTELQFNMEIFQKVQYLEQEENEKRINHAAKIIQKIFIEYFSVRIMDKQHAAIRIQSVYRGFRVKRVYLRLRTLRKYKDIAQHTWTKIDKKISYHESTPEIDDSID